MTHSISVFDLTDSLYRDGYEVKLGENALTFPLETAEMLVMDPQSRDQFRAIVLARLISAFERLARENEHQFRLQRGDFVVEPVGDEQLFVLKFTARKLSRAERRV